MQTSAASLTPSAWGSAMESSGLLQRELSKLRRALRAACALRGLGQWLLALSAACTGSYLADRAFRLPAPLRGVLLLAGSLVLVSTLAGWVVRPLVHVMPDLELALEVEGRVPQLSDALATAVAVRSGQLAASGVFAERMAAQAARGIARAALADLVAWTGARRRAALGVGAAVGLTLAALAWPGPTGLWFRRNVLLAAEQWPPRTQLALLSPGADELRVARGTDVLIRVRAEGRQPRSARAEVTILRTGRKRTLPMARREERIFEATLASVAETSEFVVRAGDGLVAPRRLTVVERPRIVEASVRVQPPAYTGLALLTPPWGEGVCQVPTGSVVAVVLTANKPIGEGAYSLGEGWTAMERTAPDQVTAQLTVEADLEVTFQVVDTLQVGMEQPLRAEFRALPDTPPTVELASRGVGDMLLAGARLPYVCVAEDDHRLTEVEVLLQVGDGGQERRLGSAVVEQLGRSWRTEAELPLAVLGVEPGDRLRLWARARDNRPPSGQSAESAPLSFRIVSLRQFLAHLLVIQRDLRRDLELQIESQRSVPEQEAAAAQRAQRNINSVVKSAAAAYSDLLEQMLHNEVLDPSAYGVYSDTIVRRLRALTEPDGPAHVLATHLAAGGRPAQAAQQVTSAVSAMGNARDAMLVLEGYAGVLASLDEIRVMESEIVREAGQRAGDILDFLQAGE